MGFFKLSRAFNNASKAIFTYVFITKKLSKKYVANVFNLVVNTDCSKLARCPTYVLKSRDNSKQEGVIV
jgi:hypothetical protein